MTTEPSTNGERAPAPRPTRAQRIVAAGFLGAFALTIITVLLTGLAVRAPRRAADAPPPAAEQRVPAAAPAAQQTSEPRSLPPDSAAAPAPSEPARASADAPDQSERSSDRAPAEGR